MVAYIEYYFSVQSVIMWKKLRQVKKITTRTVMAS